MLRFYLLGSPKITWQDAPLLIQRRSVRAILYRLSCDSEPVSRDELQLLFWPDIPETAARRNISHHLTHIRQALPAADALIASGNRIWLEPDSFWCDALELKRAALEPPVDVANLQEIAGCYRGPFLRDFDLAKCVEFGNWSIVERVALERQYLRVLKQLVEFFMARGDWIFPMGLITRIAESRDLPGFLGEWGGHLLYIGVLAVDLKYRTHRFHRRWLLLLIPVLIINIDGRVFFWDKLGQL